MWRSRRKPVLVRNKPYLVPLEDRPWSLVFSQMEKEGPDYRWIGPTHLCACGCDLFAVAARFEDKQVAFYFLDTRCLACGAFLTAPCEADDEPAID
jgi:hypothetical protein